MGGFRALHAGAGVDAAADFGRWQWGYAAYMPSAADIVGAATRADTGARAAPYASTATMPERARALIMAERATTEAQARSLGRSRSGRKLSLHQGRNPTFRFNEAIRSFGIRDHANTLLFWIVLFLPPPHRSTPELSLVVASGEKGESSFPLLRVRASKPREVGRHAGALRSAAARAAHIRHPCTMVAHCARDGGARPPQLARVPSRGANGALMPSASGPCRAPRRPTRKLARQRRETILVGKPAKKQRKYGKLLGDQWAAAPAAHGDAYAWRKFLAENLKRCECEHPRTSQSNRRKSAVFLM